MMDRRRKSAGHPKKWSTINENDTYDVRTCTFVNILRYVWCEYVNRVLLQLEIERLIFVCFCYQPFVVCDNDGATLKLFAKRRCCIGVGDSLPATYEFDATLTVADCVPPPPPIEAIAKLLLLINPLLLNSLPDKRDDSSDFCCCCDIGAAEFVVVSAAETSIGWYGW